MGPLPAREKRARGHELGLAGMGPVQGDPGDRVRGRFQHERADCSGRSACNEAHASGTGESRAGRAILEIAVRIVLNKSRIFYFAV
jgi:hypothetical protein